MPPKKRGQAAGAKAGKRARTEPAAATATTTTSTTDAAPPAAAAGEDSAAAAAGKRYFLMKSEPETRMQDGQDMKFSIQDLAKLPARTADDGHQLEPQVSTRLCTTCLAGDHVDPSNNTHPHPHVLQTDHWDGVRNYGARNVMKEMRVGDTAFFYHSNCKTPGIAGTVTIVREAYPDFTALDKKDPHYDPKVSSLTNKKTNLMSVIDLI